MRLYRAEIRVVQKLFLVTNLSETMARTPLSQLGSMTEEEENTLREQGINDAESFWLAKREAGLDTSDDGPLGIATGKPGRRAKWAGSGASAFSGSEVEDDFEQSQDRHQSRPSYSRKQDEAREARLTTDYDKWSSDMDSYDFIGVDTPEDMFRE